MEDKKVTKPANEQERKEKVSKAFADTIENYLSKMAEVDEAFSEKFASADKSIEECCYYILTEVQKSGRNGFDDPEIFGMAVHYYQEPKESLGEIKKYKANVVVNHAVELTEEEKRELKQKAMEDFMKKCLAEMVESKRKKKVETVSDVEQLSLF